MSIRKRNKYLDAGDSDEYGSSDGYQSDDAGGSRGAIGGHATKRRKVDLDESGDSEKEDEPENAAEKQKRTSRSSNTLRNQPGNHKSKTEPPEPDSRFDKFDSDEDDFAGEGDEDEDEPGADAVPESASGKVEPTSKSSALKSAARAEKAARKSGVIYISRVPPFMKPHTLKHYLEPHASKGLGRIFLTPEDHANYLQRKKAGGNKKKSFTDGWVEFNSKNEAKMAASTLNGNIIGGKKGGYYHDDLWNMKYLKGFKWSNLTEQIAAENAEREARMRDEIRKTKKENKAFLDDVERGKMLEGMENKRKAKAGDGPQNVDGGKQTGNRSGRQFEQMKVQLKSKRTKDADQPEAQRALSMIF